MTKLWILVTLSVVFTVVLPNAYAQIADGNSSVITPIDGGNELNLRPQLTPSGSSLPAISPAGSVNNGIVPGASSGQSMNSTSPLPGTSGSSNIQVPALPAATSGSSNIQILPLPSATPDTQAAPPVVPGGALSPATAGAPETTNVLDLNAQAPTPPLMGTITQEVALTIDKQPVQRGEYRGLILHLHNGTNSPLMFDGDRAYIEVNGKHIAAAADAPIEESTCPAQTIAQQTLFAAETAVTVGLLPTIHDARIGRGPILPRYGCDQKRRVATAERFGKRILWPGDDTQGIVYFQTEDDLSKGVVQLPVVTFPNMDIRGYLTAVR
jgi:hypothetical protein